MASTASDKHDRSPSNINLPPSPHGRNRQSIHSALGGGSVADILLWRNRTSATYVAMASVIFWILFEVAGYNLLSLAANSLLLLFIILFFWAKSASLLNRPLPPIPKLEVSEELVERASDEARVWINQALSIARDIAIERDRKVFFKVTLLLWVVSYIGGFFSFLTLAFIGTIISLTVPVLYERHQDLIDEKFYAVHSLLLKQYDNVLNRRSKQSKKEKKMD